MVSSVQKVIESQIPFVFSDGHAVVVFSKFYNQEHELKNIGWNLMKEWYWADTPTDCDRKRRRQAEFLVYKSFPWSLVEKIGVIDKETEQILSNYIQRSAYKPDIIVKSDWYY